MDSQLTTITQNLYGNALPAFENKSKQTTNNRIKKCKLEETVGARKRELLKNYFEDDGKLKE